jgi:hypothetical protein
MSFDTPGGDGSSSLLVSCGLAAAAAGHVVDQASGTSCLEASTAPTLGMLYPLSTSLNVSGAGNVGIGTTTPVAQLNVLGTLFGSEFRVFDFGAFAGTQLVSEMRAPSLGPQMRFVGVGAGFMGTSSWRARTSLASWCRTQAMSASVRRRRPSVLRSTATRSSTAKWSLPVSTT